MIIFIDNPNIIPYLENYFKKQISVFNLSSLYSGYIDCTDLITSISFMNTNGMPLQEYIQTIEFDMQYSVMIMNNITLFVKLMSILSHSYEGGISIILIQRDPYRDSVTESLIKFIQQRYGYNSYIVEDLSDLEYIKEPHYTPYGILNIDNDLQKYDSLFVGQ